MGKTVWKARRLTEVPSKIASPGTEAFGYLLMINCYEVWVEKSTLERGEKGIKEPVYTGRAQVRKATKYRGWGKGIAKFNELQGLVEADTAARGATFDFGFLRKQQEDGGRKRRRGNDTECIDPEEMVDEDDDFGVEDQPRHTLPPDTIVVENNIAEV